MTVASVLDARFAALADPTRRAIVERLVRGEATVGELAEPFAMTLPAVSKHVAVLEGAGLVRRWRDGRTFRCRLEAKALAAPADWLTRTRADWERRLDRLERMLRDDAER